MAAEVVCLSQQDGLYSSPAEFRGHSLGVCACFTATCQVKAFLGIQIGQELEIGGVLRVREDILDIWARVKAEGRKAPT